MISRTAGWSQLFYTFLASDFSVSQVYHGSESSNFCMVWFLNINRLVVTSLLHSMLVKRNTLRFLEHNGKKL